MKMFTSLALGLSLASGISYAVQHVDIPVHAFEVASAPANKSHWAEFSDVPKGMNIDPLLSAGNCHSLDLEKVVICHYSNARTAQLAESLFTLAKSVSQTTQQQEGVLPVLSPGTSPAPEGRWVEYRDIPKDVAVSTLTKAGELLGGDCHAMSQDNVVVCYYSDARTAGIDWETLGVKLQEASSI